MLALKSNTGFEVMDSDELYFINGGSCSFHIGPYNNGPDSYGVNVSVEWDGQDGQKHGFEVHVGMEGGIPEVGGTVY